MKKVKSLFLILSILILGFINTTNAKQKSTDSKTGYSTNNKDEVTQWGLAGLIILAAATSLYRRYYEHHHKVYKDYPSSFDLTRNSNYKK